MKKIYIDNQLHNYDFSDFDFSYAKDGYEFISENKIEKIENTISYVEAKKYLYLTTKKSDFAKPCPGTNNYICCNYAVINSQEGCFLNCSYCILQGYLKKKIPRVFVNINNILSDTKVFLENNNYKRIGTGELSDSLVYDHITGFSKKYIDFFKKIPKTVFEFKTKTVNIENLKNLNSVPENIMVSWSVNTKTIIDNEEHLAPSLEKRIQAAQLLQKKGFRIGFHFDPVFLYPNAENEYLETIDYIFTKINPKKISYISIGVFRYLPFMKDVILNNFDRTEIFNGEFFLGRDGKMRYFRPQRERLINKIIHKLYSINPKLNLYFCMESKNWWENILNQKVDSNDDAQRIIDSKL